MKNVRQRISSSLIYSVPVCVSCLLIHNRIGYLRLPTAI